MSDGAVVAADRIKAIRAALGEPYFIDEESGILLYCGDSLDLTSRLPVNCIDSVITDPPYEFGFMGKTWDRSGIATSPMLWSAVLDACKPGATLLSFGGTRTYHRMVCAIEDAGWEIRDCIQWLYGCLSEDTEILIDGEWVPYHKATAGRLALCYNAGHDELSWQPVEDLFVYDYADTAYRITSDRTDQIVSRNHRCIVERGGIVSFQLAETLQREENVPVLESVRDLLRDLPLPHEGAGGSQSLLLPGVRPEGWREADAAREAEGAGGSLRGVRHGDMEAGCVATADCCADLLQTMQWSPEGARVGRPCEQGAGCVDGGVATLLCQEDERQSESSVEGRRHDLSQARQLQADQVCPLPEEVCGNGEAGRLRDGTSADRRESASPLSVEDGGCASRQPRPAGQSQGEPGIVRQQLGSQAVRASRYAGADLARVEPIPYVGKVWCVKVPTGAFVARRNGKVFITGNSGFPKSLDLSKAIDKAAGAQREVVGTRKKRGLGGSATYAQDAWTQSQRGEIKLPITAPATPLAALWDGWGTALKPAYEPICVAMKPLDGTFAQNAIKHGVAGLNIEGGRIEARGRAAREKRPNGVAGHALSGSVDASLNGSRCVGVTDVGRWPANVLHDGSEEVLERFPQGSYNLAGTLGSDKGSRCMSFGYGQREIFGYGDKGSAARFFYCAKASRSERGEGNSHPTVKPLALMEYLCLLTMTPTGGLILDPFAGSGTTILAARAVGRPIVAFEKDPEYCKIIARRLGACFGSDDEPESVEKDSRPVQSKPCAVARSLFDSVAVV